MDDTRRCDLLQRTDLLLVCPVLDYITIVKFFSSTCCFSIFLENKSTFWLIDIAINTLSQREFLLMAFKVWVFQTLYQRHMK